MLRLSNIKKDYKVADTYVPALKGISVSFRQSEFVSILGPSGCGKTTLLNIIGGLDKYTSGDLFISGISTKDFTDHDWDVYRNHRIGFIFQSYNLIPHQTILGNVELALTISGLSKKERQEKAKKALDRVGLKGQYNKRPNQLSGGQCQRVAIARALVNEPSILLADEPTGALDTVTSVQIMELIKEISKEKLVIMVTHNPELAEKYSTRIVRLLDGEVLEDSMPFDAEDEIKEVEANKEKVLEEIKTKQKAKMSLFTAFKLSAKNLYYKAKRTILVAFAGCIGIVGVATVLAVSNGVENYIADMENDMLSGYPVYITTSTLDYGSIMGGQMGGDEESTPINPENDTTKVFISSLVKSLVHMNGVTKTNEIGQEYMDFLKKMPKEDCAHIQYNYGDQISPNMYTNFKTSDGMNHKMSISAIQATYASVLDNIENLKDYAAMISSVTVMSEIPSEASYLDLQYDVVYIEDGMSLEDVLTSKESLIAVVSKNRNTLNDLELAEYGYFSQEQFLNYCYKLAADEKYNDNPLLQLPDHLSYKTLSDKIFTWYPNNTVYQQNGTSDDLGDKYYASAYSDGSLMNETGDEYREHGRNAFGEVAGKVDCNVKCVLKLKENLNYGCLSSGGLYYTEALTEHMREYNLNSQIVQSAKKMGSVYNVELNYKFKFDGNSKESCEKYYLSSSSNAFISYFMKFMGSSGSSKQISSYSADALGGAEFPSSINFYCVDFAQKDKLTAYLDVWNNSNAEELYHVDTNGFYIGNKDNGDGTETEVYFYKDETSGKYFSVNVNKQGFALDYKGNQYRLEKDNNGELGFYLKLSDSIGEKFTLDGQVEIGNNITINSYSLASFILFKEEMQSSNIYYTELQEVPNKGGNLYSYTNSDGEKEYVLKVQNQEFNKLALDKEGNIVSKNNGYEKYRYVESENKFYFDEYKLQPDGSYKLVSTVVEDNEVKNLFVDDEIYKYANVVKNPIYEIAGNEYKLDTKGLYINASSLLGVEFNKIVIDNDEKTISLKDYSGIDFYYKNENAQEFTYYYVDYVEEDGVSYLLASDVKDYIDASGMSDSLKGLIAEKYVLNDDGSLQSVNPAYSDSALTLSQMIELKVIGDELTDLSILEIDDSLKITYTDTIGMVIAMVNTLINVITYALISFTGLALLVSTVMIGIITYVSVVERTKEIGVIRSLGGRKKDVAHLFNAETFIIGLAAGLIGIGLTYLLSFVINMIIGHFAGIYTIAALPAYQAVIMVCVSIVLTLISGLIPASSAAKQDPVNALRSE